MELPKQQIRKLRALAQHKKSIVSIGNNGLTKNVIKEIDRALKAHELIKIKVSGADKKERLELAETICEETKAGIVQLIGHVLIIYRKTIKKKKRITTKR